MSASFACHLMYDIRKPPSSILHLHLHVNVSAFKFRSTTKNYCLSLLDVSGIIEKFNVYATLAIIPRTKEINKAF